VAEAGNRLQHDAFGADGFDQGLVGGSQRMAAPGFGIALEQRVLGGMQEQEGQVDARFRQFLHFRGQQVDAVPGAGVDGDGRLLDALFLEHADEHREHHHRQVVDAVVA